MSALGPFGTAPGTWTKGPAAKRLAAATMTEEERQSAFARVVKLGPQARRFLSSSPTLTLRL
jgi:hypothetical protein